MGNKKELQEPERFIMDNPEMEKLKGMLSAYFADSEHPIPGKVNTF